MQVGISPNLSRAHWATTCNKPGRFQVSMVGARTSSMGARTEHERIACRNGSLSPKIAKKGLSGLVLFADAVAPRIVMRPHTMLIVEGARAERLTERSIIATRSSVRTMDQIEGLGCFLTSI